MYEFVLTKSVMLVFILGLVSIFVTMYNNSSINSAEDIARSEAIKLAKEIDDAIGFKGMSNTININLKPNLQVGSENIPYNLTIDKRGNVIVRLAQYPYTDILGVATFGINIQYKSGHERIICSPTQLSHLVKLEVKKESDYVVETDAVTGERQLFYEVEVSIIAHGCVHSMVFEERFAEN